MAYTPSSEELSILSVDGGCKQIYFWKTQCEECILENQVADFLFLVLAEVSAQTVGYSVLKT